MNTATRLRDAGRSWSEIRDRTGMSVRQAKAEVAADKQEVRSALAHSHRNEEARGLNEICYNMNGFRLCNHPRRDHVDGKCLGCVKYVTERNGYYTDDDLCDGFESKQAWSSPYSPYPNDVNLNLARRGGKVQGTWGGRSRAGYLGRYVNADIQVPTARRVLARLRRKASKKS
jgi:hypothetical protein